MVSVFQLIRERGSISSYKAKLIPRAKLLKVLDSARLAQSLANRQPWQFILISTLTTKQKLTEFAGNQDFAGEVAKLPKKATEILTTLS